VALADSAPQESKKHMQLPNEKKKRPIYIIDVSSLFIRQYAAHPDLNSNGEQVGGVVGSLKTIQRLSQDFSPEQVIAVWESGGSPRRRAILPEYKQGRSPGRLNRFYGDDLPDTEDNRSMQQRLLIEAFMALPVAQVYVRNCEADDVIAYLCKFMYPDAEKVILTTDKDYYQLLDENTRIYNPHKKNFVTAADVFAEFNVHPKNFALAKALCGDRSDNIPGVKGLGFKTLAQRVPLMCSSDDITTQHVIDFCRSRTDDAKIFREVVASEKIIRRNWSLVYLGAPSLSFSQMKAVREALEQFTPKLDKLAFMKFVVKNGLRTIEPHRFCSSFVPMLIRKPKNE